MAIGIDEEMFERACKKALDEYGWLLSVLVGEDLYTYDTEEFRRFVQVIALFMKQEYNSKYPRKAVMRVIDGSRDNGKS